MSDTGSIPRTDSQTQNRPMTSTREDRSWVKKPEPYKGKHSELELWLINFELYYLFNQIPAITKSLLAYSFIAGRA